MQCAEQHIVQCSNFTTEQCAQCNLQSNVHNVQSSMFRAMCAEQCTEECIYCRSVCAVQCVPVQCNLQLSSQLVNLLLLDWTRSSQLRNIANLSPPKIFAFRCLFLVDMFLRAHQQQFCCLILIFLVAITNWCDGNFEEELRPGRLSSCFSCWIDTKSRKILQGAINEAFTRFTRITRFTRGWV